MTLPLSVFSNLASPAMRIMSPLLGRTPPPTLIVLPNLFFSLTGSANSPLPLPLKKKSSPGQEPEMMSICPSPSRSTNCGVKPTHQPVGTLPLNLMRSASLGASLVPSLRWIQRMPSPNWPTSRCFLPSPKKSPTNGAAWPTSVSMNLPAACKRIGGARSGGSFGGGFRALAPASAGGVTGRRHAARNAVHIESSSREHIRLPDPWPTAWHCNRSESPARPRRKKKPRPDAVARDAANRLVNHREDGVLGHDQV